MYKALHCKLTGHTKCKPKDILVSSRDETRSDFSTSIIATLVRMIIDHRHIGGFGPVS